MNYKTLTIEMLRKVAASQPDLTLGEILYDILRPVNNKKAKYLHKDVKELMNIEDVEFYEACEKYSKNI
jgi:hypothetical protein